MKSYWFWLDPNPMTGELIRRGKSGYTNTDPDPEGRKPCDAGDRDWSDAS